MLRLFYLLVRQRMRQERTPPAPAVSVRNPQRRSFRAFPVVGVAAAVCLAVAGAVVLGYSRLEPSPVLETARETAALQLHIRSLNSAPLVVFLEAPAATRPDSDSAPPETVRITSVHNAFEPRFQVASLAARVVVGNDDPIPHNTHLSDEQGTVFNVAVPLAGVRVRKLLGRSGILHVRCDIHPWMRAWIFVPANPHHAVIWEPGQVTLRDIAPGRYRLHVWEPARSGMVRMLTLEPGETESLSLAGR